MTEWLIYVSCLVVSDSLPPHGLQPTRLLCPWNFPRQESWSGLPFPPPGDLPDPGSETGSPAPPALEGRFLITETLGKPQISYTSIKKKITLLLCGKDVGKGQSRNRKANQGATGGAQK